VALLIASAGAAHHIWRERRKRRQPATIAGKIEETETEEAP
jgi:hypothetical protein